MEDLKTNFDQINAFKAEDRQKYIGGSDTAAVMGLSRWSTPLKLFLEKTGQIQPDDLSDNEAVYFGSKLEDFIAKEFQTRMGLKVRRNNSDIIHLKYDYLRCHIDRAIVGENAFVECKNYNAFKIKELGEDEAPPEALLQCHHNMMVGNFDYCFLVCLIGGQRFVCKRIERDYELEKTILEAEVNFWENHVKTGVAPLAMANDDLDAYFNFDDGVAELDDSISDLLDSVAGLNKQYKEIKSEIDEKKNLVKQVMAGFNIAETTRYNISYKETSRSSFDYKAMIKDGLLTEKQVLDYTRTTAHRRFMFKPKKD